MSVSSTTLALRYVGNNSDSTPYAITFPFLERSHIHVAVETLTILGELYPRDEVIVDDELYTFTDYQFPMDPETSPAIAVGQVIRVLKVAESGDVWTRDYEVALIQDVGGIKVVTINSSDAADFDAGAMGGGDEDEVYLVEGGVLEPSEYSVTREADGSGGTLTTAEAVDDESFITIYREVPLTQPTQFQLAGPFPSTSAETALDRMLMQIQQLGRRVNQLAGENPGDFVAPPSGNPDSSRDTATWDGPGNRSTVKPSFVGQIGSERTTSSLWIARSATTGDWYKGGDSVIRVVVAPFDTEVEDSSIYPLVTLTEPTTIRGVTVASSMPAGSAIQIGLKAGNAAEINLVVAGVMLLPEGDLIATAESFTPETIYPAGTQIHFSITNALDGSDATEGLTITLHCDNSGTEPYVYVP